MVAIKKSDGYSTILKQQYGRKYYTDAVLRGSPLLGTIPKDTGWGGSNTRMVVDVGPGGGVSAKFATAQANASYGKEYAFLPETGKFYTVFSIEGEALKAARSEPMAFATNTELAIDRAKNAWVRLMSAYAFGDGSGAIGQVGSVSTTTLTLKNKYDAVNFWVGQKIVSSDTATGTTDDNQPLTITAVNPALGTLTTSVTWTAGGNFANDDYLFVEGTKGLVIKGLSAWIPKTAPTGGDSFYGLDRSVAPYALAGCRYTATTADSNIVNALRHAATEHSSFMNAGNIDIILMHPQDASQVHDYLGTKTDMFQEVKSRAPDMSRQLTKKGDMRSYVEAQREVDAIAATIGYQGVAISTGMGSAMLIEDKYCPRRTAFMLNMSTWELGSMGDLLGFLNHAGEDMIAVYNDDAIEGRMGGYPVMVCRKPFENCVVDLTAVASF